ncbi:hypothetical protein [Novosphingobium sp. Fuku2-ISO-50]|uniref:hypothetical protein n=1 Tax=Novosphingobium sp. Fuku2-ISO-50 TaxID=1739114 RepID=UPI0012E3C095|nr:hypothetical protein [Novosphingobium sp. Fuku2-ISO-50]
MRQSLSSPTPRSPSSRQARHLPRHAAIYVLCIGVISLFQIALGANLLVLLAIDAVCMAAVWPMTRTNFDPTDLLYLSLCLYYGTFSLILKTLVLQPVQMNLAVPYLTSAYLVGGFGMITLAYRTVGRVMTRHYPGTRLRTWTWLERSYADPAFLAQYTMPMSVIGLVFTIVVSLTSHTPQEIANGLAESNGLASLGAFSPLIQLALAMQLALLKQRNSFSDRVLIIVTLTITLVLTVLNNQKALAFLMSMTGVVFIIAYRIRIQPRFIVMAITAAAIAFLYVIPLVHIVRGLNVDKSERLAETVKILDEANFNPIELQEIEGKLPGADASSSLAKQMDYLYPYLLGTDRFTQLMPIDQTARADGRAPLGVNEYLANTAENILPKNIVGEHKLFALDDEIAWRYSIREDNTVSRPALGMLGTGYGVAGQWGLLLLAPFVTFISFALVKLVCNGSIWQNPWAIFIASYIFFDGEADVTLITSLARGFIPLAIIAWGFAMLHKVMRKSGSVSQKARLAP